MLDSDIGNHLPETATLTLVGMSFKLSRSDLVGLWSKFGREMVAGKADGISYSKKHGSLFISIQRAPEKTSEWGEPAFYLMVCTPQLFKHGEGYGQIATIGVSVDVATYATAFDIDLAFRIAAGQ